ncbi:MAG: serine hydrolase domain-containing protein [Pseudomonadota bacterium]
MTQNSLQPAENNATPAPGLIIQGTVAPGFESVKALYEHNMRTLKERNTQLCIYVGEEKVVDLWASAIGDADFSPDKLANIFSSGKSFEAIAMAALAGQGLLDYSAKITEYWPEFGAHGKDTLTVADMMRHEAGLAAFDQSFEPEDLLVESIKLNKVGQVIENQAAKFRKGDGNKREYHAATRGWVVNEVFRRIEPQGRTIGQFLRDEISSRLDADVFIGVHESELDRRSAVAPLGFGFYLRESFKPKFLGRRVERNIFQLIRRMLQIMPLMRNRSRPKAPAPVKGMQNIAIVNGPMLASGESPSFNANCSARGLAKVAAAMANGGRLANQEVLNETAWAALHEAPIEANMGFNTTFTQGGVATFPPSTSASGAMDKALNQGREGFFGWMGLGGSIFQWHPEYKIGFGYVPTSLNILDFLNERGKTYQAEVLNCVRKLNNGG